MNARADPARLQERQTDDADRALISICRAALDAISQEAAAEAIISEMQKHYDRLVPVYPELPWMYSTSQHDAHFLRNKLKEHASSATDGWCKNMRAQIKAVAAWERETDSIRKSIGLSTACKRCDQAHDLASKRVAAVAATPATTIFGCSWKSTVAASWFSAGYSIGFDLGERLAMSILDDIRLLGTGGNNGGKIKLVERKAA